MRYSNEELFFVTEKEYESWLDLTAREFFLTCINRLEWVIKDTVGRANWMETDIEHLRNYRLKSIEFYRQKLGDKK